MPSKSRRTSFSINPELAVARLLSACSRCRQAKVKCDQKLPACSQCEKAGKEKECADPNDQFARGKERSFVTALETYVEKLHRQLEYAKSRKASVAMHELELTLPSNDFERKDSMALIRAGVYRKAAREMATADVNTLVSDFGYLSVNATTRDFEPSASNMTFARLVLAATTNDLIHEPRTNNLPPRQAAQSMVQYYMGNIYTLFPAFSHTHFMSVFENAYNPDPLQHISSSDYWLLYLVLAIGSTAQSRKHEDEYYSNGVELVAKALPYADEALKPGYPTQIQSLLLLTQYSMLDPTHFDSWHLIGFTCRAVIDLGYHMDPPNANDKEALDARRRMFYCVYSLDRAISMVHARAFSFTDNAVAVSFPSPTSLTQEAADNGPTAPPVSSTDASLLHFQLRRAQSHWYQALFQSNPNEPLPDGTSFVWQMCQDMREWTEALPDTLDPCMRDLFDLEIRYSYVYCIAPSARTPNLTAYGRMLIFEHAIAYLNLIYEVAQAPSKSAFYTFHDALRVYFMGSQFVAVLWDDWDALLSGANVPVPLSLPGKPSPPPLPQRLDRSAPGDNLDRSLRALEKVSLTLKKYGERWEDTLALMQNFETISAGVLASLQAKKQARENRTVSPAHQQPQYESFQQYSDSQERRRVPHSEESQGSQHSQHSEYSQHSQTSTHGHQSPQNLQFQDVQWIDLDVSKMVQGDG